MAHWVYISKNKQDILKTGLFAGFGKSMVNIMESEQVVYMRPFREPLDAAAHKVLLDFLSLETIQHLIEKQKEKTNIFLSSALF